MKTDEIVDNKSRSEWEFLIRELVHDEINRKILIRHLLDGLTLSQIAEEIGFELRQTNRRYNKARTQLFKHI